MRIWLRTVKLWLVVIALSTPSWGLAQETEEYDGPSLAEVARKERERRANFKKEVRIITNANIQEVKGLVSVAGSSPSPGTTAEGEEEEPEEGAQETKRDEAEWQGLFEEARLNLKNAVNRGLVLQLKMNDLRNSYFGEDDGTTQARIQRQLQETQKEIESNRQEVQAAQRAVSELEQEASSEGLAPGQIRELVGDLPDEETVTTSPDS